MSPRARTSGELLESVSDTPPIFLKTIRISGPTSRRSSPIGAPVRESNWDLAPTSVTTPRTRSFRSAALPSDFRAESPLQRRSLCALQLRQINRRAQMAEGRKAGGGLARPVTPSADLAKITGSSPLPRSQVVSKVWDHIRKNNLQNPQNKREIVADSTLKPIFGGKDRVSMFEMNKHLSNHLK